MKLVLPRSVAFAALFLAALTCSAQSAQTTPPAQQPPAAQPAPPHKGTVLFSRSTDEAAPAPTQVKTLPGATKPARANSEQSPAPEVPEGASNAPEVHPSQVETLHGVKNSVRADSEPLAPPQVVALDLDVHLLPADQQIAVRALLTLRNDGNSPLTLIPLQISSSLNWERIRLTTPNGQAQAIPLHVVTVNSDADHTGQLHQAAVPLAAPLQPGQSLSLDVTYSGPIALSARRLQSIGAPDSLALHSDWDQISLPFTGLRGFGNVLWYPVVSTPVLLGDGARLFDEIGTHKLRLSGARFRLRLTVEFPHGQAPTVVLINGRSLPLAITEPSGSLDQTQEVASIATADSGLAILGFESPSLFVAIRAPNPGPNLTAWALPEDNVAVDFWTAAAANVTPFLKTWLGPEPRSPLTLLDLPDPGDVPFETGALLAAPLREPHSKANSLNGVLVHSLTHAWLALPNSPASPASPNSPAAPNSSLSPTSPPPPAWLNEGVATFMGTLWMEKQHGRDFVLGALEADRAALALAEPASPGQSPGQPLASAISPVYYRTKAAYVLWMLRDLAGDPALSAALRTYYDSAANLNSANPANGNSTAPSAYDVANDKLDSGSALNQGTASQAAEKQSLVSGHDFSRADNAAKTSGAGRDGFQPIHSSPAESSSANSSLNSTTPATPTHAEGVSAWTATPTHAEGVSARTASPFEKLLEASASHPDLAWFFADWVDADKGLPDLAIDGVFPTSASAGNWLVAVNVSNSGYAAAYVPVTVRSGTGDNARSVTQRLRIPARGKTSIRILVQGKPTEVQVNDGAVPETQASVHITRLDDPAATSPNSSQSNPPKR